jgi:hypothetical protein
MGAWAEGVELILNFHFPSHKIPYRLERTLAFAAIHVGQIEIFHFTNKRLASVYLQQLYESLLLISSSCTCAWFNTKMIYALTFDVI